jgi:hypothetical protein
MQPGMYPPPPSASMGKVKPSGWWFALAGLIPVAGIIVAIVIFAVGMAAFLERIDDLQRVEVPGAETITLREGNYSVYQEYDGAAGDGSGTYGSASVSISGPSGEEVDLDPYDSRVTYSGSDDEGIAMSSFRADTSGEYTVSTDGPESVTIAIGPGLGRGIVSTVVGAFAVAGLSVLAGLVIAVVVGVRRSQNRNRMRGPMPPPGPPGGWGQPAYGGPYAQGPYAQGGYGSGPYAPAPGYGQRPGPPVG